METKEEGVFTIYRAGELVAIVKRDDITKKHLVYMVRDGTGEDIVELINSNQKEL